MKNTRKWQFYILYIILSASFFIYYLFPSDSVKNHITSYLKKHSQDLNISIEHIKPVIPPGLRFQSVILYHLNRPLFCAKQLKIIPEFLTFFGSTARYTLKGIAYEGILEGKIDVAKTGLDHKIKSDITLSGIQLNNIPAIQNLPYRILSGKFDGILKYNNEKASEGIANARITITDCNLKLSAPVFDLDCLTFGKIEAEMSFNRPELCLKKCIMKGNRIDVLISGIVMINKTLGKSLLNLSGTITPLIQEDTENDFPGNFLFRNKTGKKKLSFRIHGTIDEPEFSFNE